MVRSLVACLCLVHAASFSPAADLPTHARHPASAVAEAPRSSRRDFAAGVLTSVLFPAAVLADDRAGTKEDPAYKNCLSKCLYFCTKDKVESKDRMTCLKEECKPKCATNPQQLMLGVPNK